MNDRVSRRDPRVSIAVEGPSTPPDRRSPHGPASSVGDVSELQCGMQDDLARRLEPSPYDATPGTVYRQEIDRRDATQLRGWDPSRLAESSGTISSTTGPAARFGRVWLGSPLRATVNSQPLDGNPTRSMHAYARSRRASFQSPSQAIACTPEFPSGRATLHPPCRGSFGP